MNANLTYTEKFYENFVKFIFLAKATVKFNNISKIINTDSKRLFPIFLRLCTYFWHINSLENNYAVSISVYLYRVNQKLSLTSAFVFFLVEGTPLKY